MKTNDRLLVSSRIVPTLATALFFSAHLAAKAEVANWSGSGDGSSWNQAANWSDVNNAAPVNGDSLVFGLSGGTLNDNLGGTLTTFGVTFANSAGAYTLNTGNSSSLFLSGAIIGAYPGVLNSSGVLQTVNLNLSLDWGYYTFSSPNGGTLALNGSLTLNPGGLAFFDSTCSAGNLTVDGTTGLINGLEGSALMFSGVTPTGLATLSGSSIVPYTAYTTVGTSSTGGTIASGNNIELLDTSASGSFPAGGATVNTITVLQPGNAGGTQTDTITIGGTSVLTFGNNGGIYLLGNTLLNKACLSIANGGWITAGSSSSPANLIFAINGNNPNNQASVACGIEDNLSGGHVSVIMTGPGTMNYATSTSNSYSGGTYVTEGQLQFGQPTQLGTGAAYVGSNATLYYIGTGTLTNPLYLSSGLGATYGVSAVNGIGTAGAFAYSGTTLTLSGTMNLMGSPVTAAPGCRLSSISSPNLNITGQITGTGTLDLISAHTGTNKLSNPNTSGPNANNWQGGIIVDGPQGAHAVNMTLQMGGNNQIPSGPNAGNVTLIPAETTIFSRFDLNGTSQTINGLIGNASGTGSTSNQLVNLAASTAASLTLGANDATATFTGYSVDSAGGPLSITKIGIGTQSFSSPSYPFGYHGATTVNAGTLALIGQAFIPNCPTFNVAAAGTFDVSQLTGGFTLGASQTLDCVGTIIPGSIALAISGTVQPLVASTIGGLTNEGNMAFASGSTYDWDINNATGVAGTASGWGLLNIVGGTLTINASDASPMNVNISSQGANAANFNASVSKSWIIAQTTGGVTGYTDPGQFAINTSAFQNAPTSATQWSVSVVGNNLVLTYNAFSAITAFAPLSGAETVLQNTAGPTGTATFSVTANTSATPTFTWQQGATTLVNGGNTAGGGNVSIVTSGSGTALSPYVSTLTLTAVDASVPGADAGIITATVSETFNGPQSGSTPTTLSVIDKPYNLNVAQTGSPANANYNFTDPYPWSGGLALLTSTANGTTPFTYAWYLNGNAIVGATNSAYVVDITATNGGSYTVVISNADGSTTSGTTVISPATTFVPNQMIYEPFDSYSPGPTFVGGTAPDTFSAAQGLTNLYNQLTYEPSYWTIDGSPAGYSEVLANGLDGGGENQFGGEYPWPGLAGNSINEFYWTGSTTHTRLRLTHEGSTLFAPGGPNTNIYFSCLMSVVSLGSGSFDGEQSVFAGFTTAAGNEACNLEFWTEDLFGSDGGNQMLVGLGKGNGTTTGNPTAGLNINPPNVLWTAANTSPLGNNTWSQQTILVVGCYTVNSGPGGFDDTVSLWIDPPKSSLGAATPPPPFLGPTSFGGTVANSVPQDFVLLPDYAPASHRITDLRIGTTWASVTPPAAPTLSVNNVLLTPCSGAGTAVFTSENAGNPANSYSWTGPTGPLTDTTLGDGAVITGSTTSTLTITGVTHAELGTYTVTASNIDPAPSDGGATLTGSASGTLSLAKPTLGIQYVPGSPSSVVLSWLATTPSCFVLQKATTLSPTQNWSAVSEPVVVAGGYNTVTISPAPAVPTFYGLVTSP